ncbi:MAG: hypothetical protein HQ504_07550 [Rhodospirillaceae bacterium]|nr:hypothetical protein [Rhodospirillaceae bacterium]
MSSITGIPGSIPARTIALTKERPRGYDSAEEVKNRAGATTSNETAAERRALNRLDKVLDAHRPPRSDVPRGFYIDLNI